MQTRESGMLSLESFEDLIPYLNRILHRKERQHFIRIHLRNTDLGIWNLEAGIFRGSYYTPE